MLWLGSRDNQEFEFEVNESVATQSVTLKKMMEDGCGADKVIPLPKITSHILDKVIEYCNKHAEPASPGDTVGATNKSAEDGFKIFDADFVNVELDTLIDLMLAANYLDIKGLLNLTRQTITNMVKVNMPEEVCKVKIQKELSTPSTTSSSWRKQEEARLQAYMADLQETEMEVMTLFAVDGEECRKCGHHPEQPPLEIVKYPGPSPCDYPLLELKVELELTVNLHSTIIAMMVFLRKLEGPWPLQNLWKEHGGGIQYCLTWSLYMTYLQEYYKRNSPEALAPQVEANAAVGPNLNGDNGNDLTTLFNSVQLLDMLKRCDKKHNVDEISLNDKLTNCAHQITSVEYAGLTPTSIALKCIMAETGLLFELLMSWTGMVSEVIFCSRIRKLAFRFMTYKGPGCIEAAATMMAITKEAKLMRELLKNKCEEINEPFSWSVFIREATFDAMSRIWEKCSALEESIGGNTATKLISDESDEKNPSEKELANMDNLLQRNSLT